MRTRNALRRSAPAATVLIFALMAAISHCRAEPALPPDRAEDSYAIYSLLLPKGLIAQMSPSTNQRWAIGALTVNAQDINPALAPEAQLTPPKDNSKGFLEAVADYNRRKDERFLLTRDFQLNRPYDLLSPAEVEEFREARTAPHPGSSLQAKYSAYAGIIYFSAVYFNPAKTAALVYRLDWCGSLCSQAQWVYLEKHNGQWVRRSGSATE